MTAAAAFVAGLLAVIVLERTTRDVMARPVLARLNYRDHELPTASGLLLLAAVIAVEGGRLLVELVVDGRPDLTPERVAVLLVVVAFGFLGLVDDLLGDGDDRGLKGHVGAVLRGRVTTGFIKLAGGAAVAVFVSALLLGGDALDVIVGGAVIALAANMGNLFDRAPGRTLKVGLIAYVPLAVATAAGASGVALAAVAGAAVGLLPGDLRERSMLGDTGANAWGAALGVVAVATVGAPGRAAIASVLLALTLLSEVVSFSRVIAAVPPLRAVDRLGRLPEDAP